MAGESEPGRRGGGEAYVCLHGHFYQPPRENPWLEAVEVQADARPYHDWNERVCAESYAPNAAARVLDSGGKIVDIVSNYERMSFDFGPTLLSWMEEHAPAVYDAVLRADRESRKRFSGHGSAIAQCYNHLIMPLATESDRRMQVVWGCRDFHHRFGRHPEGMWIPETAVDLKTLDFMAEQGIRFSILAPHQAARVRPLDGGAWTEMTEGRIDTSMPYRCLLPSGRAIDLFFFDRRIADAVAFGDLLKSGRRLAERLAESLSACSGPAPLVHFATDGETFGHHHRFGEMALAYCLRQIEEKGLAALTVYGEHLDRRPPSFEVEVREQTSWSCSHGIERWRSDCGCRTGGGRHTRQAWRTPLRTAIDRLRADVESCLVGALPRFVNDPAAAREDYIGVLLDHTPANIDRFFATHARAPLPPQDQTALLGLMEMYRHAMLMATSCGWFFYDIAGIETVQVMKHAGRVMDLLREAGAADAGPAFLATLAEAESNSIEYGNGDAVWNRFVLPAVVDLPRAALHVAARSLFPACAGSRWYHFRVGYDALERVSSKAGTLATGRCRIRSGLTRAENSFVFAAYLGADQRIVAGAAPPGDGPLEAVREAHRCGDAGRVVHLIGEGFSYFASGWGDLIPDERRRLLELLLDPSLQAFHRASERAVGDHAALMEQTGEGGVHLSLSHEAWLGIVLSDRLSAALLADPPEIARAASIAAHLQRIREHADPALLRFAFSTALARRCAALARAPDDRRPMDDILLLLGMLDALSIHPDLRESQDIVFALAKAHLDAWRERAGRGDAEVGARVEGMLRIADRLGLRLA